MVKRTGATLEAAEFQDVFKLLRDADATFGNMEGNLADVEQFDGPLRGMMGDKDVAPSLKAMGFDLMNRANNHVFDSDKEGMFSTMAQLDAAGIVHAGTGKNLEDARAPAYFDSPKGRVGAGRDACAAQPERLCQRRAPIGAATSAASRG